MRVCVCVSVCLFRYVGIVSCRYIKETHGMKDDDNDNDREKNGNFGNSFHFRQIHTHTPMDEFDFKRRNISTLNGPEFNWWWNWLTMTHPRNPSKTKLNNLSMAVCVSAEQCATAKPISIQAINEPERKKNRTTKKFYWLNGWTLMVNKHSDYDKYIAVVWRGRVLNKQMDRSIMLHLRNQISAVERFFYVKCDFLLSPSICLTI